MSRSVASEQSHEHATVDLDGYPPAGDVAFRCWTVVGKFHDETVFAHSWFEARSKAAALFGVALEKVEATRIDDDEARVDASMGRCA